MVHFQGKIAVFAKLPSHSAILKPIQTNMQYNIIYIVLYYIVSVMNTFSKIYMLIQLCRPLIDISLVWRLLRSVGIAWVNDLSPVRQSGPFCLEVILELFQPNTALVVGCPTHFQFFALALLVQCAMCNVHFGAQSAVVT